MNLSTSSSRSLMAFGDNNSGSFLAMKHLAKMKLGADWDGDGDSPPLYPDQNSGSFQLMAALDNYDASHDDKKKKKKKKKSSLSGSLLRRKR